MTSDLNDETTKNFFKENNYFGVDPDRIHFFRQLSMPTINFEGKIMFETRQTLSLCPNGNGAVFEAIAVSKETQDSLRDNGVEYIHITAIDNILSKGLDPLQVGMNYEIGLKGNTKFIRKLYPKEQVGVFVKKDGVLEIIEYSELGDSLAVETFEDGRLKYDQGN